MSIPSDLTEQKCTVSIVSHMQMSYVTELLSDLELISYFIDQIVLTLNCPEEHDLSGYRNRITLIENESPKGFGANHNAAFEKCSSDYFFILNPDIRLNGCDFKILMSQLNHAAVGIVSPSIVNEDGDVEDHARLYPTIADLFGRRFSSKKEIVKGSIDTGSFDWVGGMFLAIRSHTFAAVGGFDERYFLYCEDIDLCRKVKESGLEVRVDERTKAIHKAQRASRKSLKMFLIHFSSMVKYFRKWEWGI